jgi:hypothetical protein
MDLRSGTVIPANAIKGTVYCAPNKTYGKGPFIAGQDKKFVVTSSCLNWEVAYPISNLLSGSGIMPSSNVWGIAGKNVTALKRPNSRLLFPASLMDQVSVSWFGITNRIRNPKKPLHIKHPSRKY